MKIFVKDSSSVLDYQIDWTSWLNTDTIANSTWSADSGITIKSSDFTDTTTTVWLSGGTINSSYTVTNHIVTDSGREEDRSLMIKIYNL